MATILEVKPIDQVTTKDSRSEMLMFFGIMREKKEYEMLRAMKDIADARYKVKSFKRQIREIEKNISKLKVGKSIPIPIPIPPATEVAKAVPIPPAIEEAKPVELNSYYCTATPVIDPSKFVKPSLFIIKSADYIPDWKCEKCDLEPFSSRKLLKGHISNVHSY
jgi:hypothetical protein